MGSKFYSITTENELRQVVEKEELALIRDDEVEGRIPGVYLMDAAAKIIVGCCGKLLRTFKNLEPLIFIGFQ